MVARLSRDYLQMTPGLLTLRLSVALPPSAASVADEIEVIRPAGPITREHRRRFRIAAVGAYRDARSDVGESSNREENIALSARDARPRNGVGLRWSHLGMDPRGELRFASIGGDHRARDRLQSPRREIRTRVMIV